MRRLGGRPAAPPGARRRLRRLRDAARRAAATRRCSTRPPPAPTCATVRERSLEVLGRADLDDAGRPPHRGRLRVRDGGRARGAAHRDRAPGPADASGGRLPPAGAPRPARPGRRPRAAGCEIPGGTFAMGADGDGFAYDCERPRHARAAGAVPDRPRPVTDGRAPGLHRRRGLRAAASSGPTRAGPGASARAREAPLYWERDGEGGWLARRFDRRRAGRGRACRCAT